MSFVCMCVLVKLNQKISHNKGSQKRVKQPHLKAKQDG